MKTILNILLLMVIIIPCRAQKVKPALNLAQGETYYTISIVNSTISQTISGQAMTYTVGMSAKTAFKVIAIKDTTYDMEVAYKSIGMKMVSPQGTLDFSSGKADAADVPSKILTAMIDQPFLVTLSKSGKVLSVQNIEKIMNFVFGGMTTIDSAQKAQLKGQLMQSFGEESFKNNLEQTLAIYPSVKVSKNDKWVINNQVQSVMAADIQSTYQLQDITDTYYLIHGDSKINTLKDKESQVNGMPVTYNLNGTIVSDIKADKKTGWVMEAKLKQDISGSFTIKPNERVPGGMIIPMTLHSDIITTDQ
jgi:uncharacterized protein YidB (DUF937 family)